MDHPDGAGDRNAFYLSFVRWAEGQPLLRAALLTSTLAVPGAAADAFSDYDIILVLDNIYPYHTRQGWLADFGPVLAVYHDPIELEEGFPRSGYVTQYEDGLKIDFTLWTVGLLRKYVSGRCLPPELDAGYRVLVDKEGLASGLPAPTHRAYIPGPPGEEDYRKQVEQFYLVAIYVAKYLWRGDRMAARYVMVNYLHDEHLRPLLEWHMEIDHGWDLRPGPYGRGLWKWLRADLWEGLMKTYVGPGLEENWLALFDTIALMHTVGCEIADRMSFRYPEENERRVLELIQRMRETPRG